MAVDRRVARTRNALYDALVALIRRKPYERITVEDILREADIGRATFYAHFTSKDDLLERSLERLRALLVRAQADGQSPSRALFEHVGAFRDIPVALGPGRGAAIVRGAVDRVLTEWLGALLPAELPGGLPRELAVRHVVAVFETTLGWWLERASGLSPAEAHAMFARMLRDGLPEDACAPFV